MDRILVYPGGTPLDTDLLGTNRNAMIALNALMQATLGVFPTIDGLAVTQTLPASMNVMIAPGSLTQLGVLDSAAYGTLGTDTVSPCLKMGINTAPTFLTLSAPPAAGTSINYLVEAAFQEADSGATVLPYYNAANPSQPFLGPANGGGAQPTLRQQRVALQVKGGAPANSGSQATPSVDAGWVALAIVTVAAGTSQIIDANVSPAPSAPRVAYKLPTLRPGFASIQVFASSGIFTVPAGVTRAKITAIGGGGAGGTHQTSPGGGGGAGGRTTKFVDFLYPGSTIPVTVGAAGLTVPSPNTGGFGGTSSFGTFLSATGGQGGAGGTVPGATAGGNGGIGVGGDLNFAGAFGTDGIALTTTGGAGGGPGGGRGSSGTLGIAAIGYGGGGGGGGASQPNGAGSGFPGGNGGPGLIYVEY